MKKQARIMITDKCNYACYYCINKNKEVRNTFKSCNISDILKNEYSSYCITGGEPLLTYNKLTNLIKYLHYHSPTTSIYLYTNAELLDEEKAKDLARLGVKSINIGAHNLVLSYFTITKWMDINDIIPIRIHRWNELKDDYLEHECYEANVPIKYWEMNKCDTVDEDRFFLESF